VVNYTNIISSIINTATAPTSSKNLHKVVKQQHQPHLLQIYISSNLFFYLMVKQQHERPFHPSTEKTAATNTSSFPINQQNSAIAYFKLA